MKVKTIKLLTAGIVLGMGVVTFASVANSQSFVKAEAVTEKTMHGITNMYGNEWMSFDLSPFDTYFFDNCAGKNYTLTDGLLSYNSTEAGNTVFHANGAGGNLRCGAEINAKYVGKLDTIEYIKVTFFVDGIDSDVLATLTYGTNPYVDSLTMNTKELELNIGNVESLSVTSSSADVTWEVSPAGVVTLSGTGRTISVTAVSAGTATITAKLTDNPSISDTCDVTVNEKTATKLSTPVGVVLNQIGDGGKIVAFAPVTNASGYQAVFHKVSDSSTIVATTSNGGRLADCWSGLTNGESYRIGIVAVGTGDYTNSDESTLVGPFTCFKTGEAYANYFLSATNVCDSTGASMNITQSVWNDVKEKWNDVYYAQRQDEFKAKTSQAATDAIARYTYILGKYSESDYTYLTDFINLNVARPSSVALSTVMAENNSSTIVIIISALAVVTCITLAFAIRKKHN